MGNTETDIPQRMAWQRLRDEKTQEFRERLFSDHHDGSNEIRIDNIPIEIQNLSFSYGVGRMHLVQKERISVQQGQVVAFTGELGDGKSTLLKLLGNALVPNPKCLKGEGAACG